MIFRTTAFALRTAVLLPAVFAAALTPQTAGAQGRLEARFSASLAGIQLGKGTWIVDIGENQFTAAASGGTTGVLKMFASGDGEGVARAVLSPTGQVLASNYISTVRMDKKADEVRITVNGGTVKELFVEPPPKPDPERIVVTDADRRGVMDPMTGAVMRVAGTGDPVSPDVCQRNLALFDGRMRYNLKLAYKRTERVRAELGYQGPAIVCSVMFTPISGHIPNRATIKYMIENHDTEVWLAPIAGTRFLALYRVQTPTPVGLAVLEATHWVSTAQGMQTARPARTQ